MTFGSLYLTKRKKNWFVHHYKEEQFWYAAPNDVHNSKPKNIETILYSGNVNRLPLYNFFVCASLCE